MKMDVSGIYMQLEGKEFVEEYHVRHKVKSALILRNYNTKKAMESVKNIVSSIMGKTVVEIGAGVGYLAIEMAKYAKRVFAIEADPAWSWYFTEYLYKNKPKNLTWVFGSADEIPIIADVAIICSCSGIKDMKKKAYKMAKKVLIL